MSVLESVSRSPEVKPPSGAPASAEAAKPVANPRAAVNVAKFVPLLLQLALLVLVYHRFDLENGLRFYAVHLWCLVAFGVHYFVPFAWKKQALFGLTLLGAFVVLGPEVPRAISDLGPYFVNLADTLPKTGRALLVLLGVGLVMFGIMRMPLPYAVRLVVLLALAGGLAYLRWHSPEWIKATPKDSGSWERLWLAGLYWRLIGMLFMFRMILFCHECKISKKPESLKDFLNYFFILPNFTIPIFPIVDYAAYKKSYYVEDIHKSAQRGLSWMMRGALQLCVHRYIYHHWVLLPEEVGSPWTLLQFIVVPYLLYIRISGQFHIIAGMMHLFGYKLPETYRKYFLAESFTDFWRRINIYWKDFMIKVFYYPAYFRLRKKNETLALVVATLWVFTATTLLHAYQYFWLANKPGIAPKDVIFWGTLGVLVLYNVLRQAQAGAKPKTQRAPLSGPRLWLKKVGGTVMVFMTIAILWSIWSSNSVSEWWSQVAYWNADLGSGVMEAGE